MYKNANRFLLDSGTAEIFYLFTYLLNLINKKN